MWLWAGSGACSLRCATLCWSPWRRRAARSWHAVPAGSQERLALHVLALALTLTALQLALKAQSLSPIVLEVAGLPQHLHAHLAESSMDMNFPPWHWSERPARAQASLRSSAPFFIRRKKVRSDERASLLGVAAAVILFFKNAETPGAFLRHQVGGQGLRGGGLGGRLPGHCVETSAHNPVRHPELGLHYVSGALRHGLGQPGLHGIPTRWCSAPLRSLRTLTP